MGVANNEDFYKEEQTQLLLEKLRKLSHYDLERLKECFLWEYKWHPENKEDIAEIIGCINGLLL